MIYEDVLPQYLAIGVTWDRFMDSCPKELEPYEKAYKIKQTEEDIKQWQLGQYILAAISTIGKGKYPKKPMFQIKEVEKICNYKESDEEVAIYEMKQRISLLRKSGLPESPM